MTDEKTANIFTSCQPCVFAQFDDKKQTGCDLGRLDRFHALGQTKLDNDESFFIIKSICNTCRGDAWANKKRGKNLIAEVEREVQIQFDFIITAINGEDHAQIVNRCIKKAGECVSQKKIKPKNVVFVITNKDVNYQTLYNTLDEIISPYGIKCKLVRVVEEDSDIYRCLDMGVQKCISRYFGHFSLNDLIPNNLLIMLNEHINDDLKKIVMVEPFKDMSGLILHKSLYSLLGRNYNMLIQDKVKELVQEQEAENQILDWETLWKRQPLLSS